MNITVTSAVVREAALINLLGRETGSAYLDRVKTELWCLREGINTREHPEIWDITLGELTTSELIETLLYSENDTHDSAAMLLCTIQELS